MREWRYSLTRHYLHLSGKLHALAALAPSQWTHPYHFNMRLGDPRTKSVGDEERSDLAGN